MRRNAQTIGDGSRKCFWVTDGGSIDVKNREPAIGYDPVIFLPPFPYGGRR